MSKKGAKMKSEEVILESDILTLQNKLEENNLPENSKTDISNKLDTKILQKEESRNTKLVAQYIRS